jgi:hypothetical protein
LKPINQKRVGEFAGTSASRPFIIDSRYQSS